jgi:ABC-type multidrug transport system fused ATPase/permease subunit
MAVPLERIVAILAYVYPAFAFGFFFIASLVVTLTLQKQSPEERKVGSRMRHGYLIALFAFLVTLYVAEALTLIINGLTRGPWPEDDLIVGRLFCVLAFAVQLAQLFDKPHPVWYPFRGAWLIGVAAEIATVVTIVLLFESSRPDLLELTQISLSSVRLLLLAALSIGSTQATPSSLDKGSDEERQQLIPKTTAASPNAQANYGSAEESGSASEQEPDSNSDSKSDIDSGDPEATWEQLNQGLRDRLKEAGGWVQYAKEYAILLPYLWPTRSITLQLRLVGVVLCLSAMSIVNVLIPRQTAIIIDNLGGNGSTSPWPAVTVFVALKAISSSVGIPLLQEWLIIPLQFFSKEHMSRAIYSHIMLLSADFHDSKTTSDMQTAFYGGACVFEIIEQILLYAVPMAADLVIAVGYLSAKFGPYEGLITIATGVAFLLLTGRLIDSSRQATKARRSAMYKEHFLRSTGFTGWHTVAAFNQVGFECNRHANAVAARYTTEKKFSMEWQISFGIQSTALTFGFVASTFLAVAQIRAGKASPGQFAMLLAYWAELTGPLQFISRIGKRLSDNFIEAEHTLSIMRTKPSVQNKASVRPLKFDKGEVQFDKVCFSYDGKKQILDTVSLAVPAGQTVAFVGATGAGKSTMLKLLNRFYDVTGGVVRIDGQDIREVDLYSLRDRIGVVPQDPILFDDTVINNVRYGKITASDEEVFEACRAACIHDKIEGFTQGYETRVGERGMKLSGGELQRVAIARAILKRPDLVLLDEATSAIDTETEYSIQQSLKELCKGRTTFVVAHRLSTIMNADTIVVVDKGQILEQGNHEDLIVRGGKYASLWAKQVFLKPKEPPKSDDESTSVSVVNDLSTAQNEAELAKATSNNPEKEDGTTETKGDSSSDS